MGKKPVAEKLAEFINENIMPDRVCGGESVKEVSNFVEKVNKKCFTAYEIADNVGCCVSCIKKYLNDLFNKCGSQGVEICKAKTLKGRWTTAYVFHKRCFAYEISSDVLLSKKEGETKETIADKLVEFINQNVDKQLFFTTFEIASNVDASSTYIRNLLRNFYNRYGDEAVTIKRKEKIFNGYTIQTYCFRKFCQKSDLSFNNGKFYKKHKNYYF